MKKERIFISALILVALVSPSLPVGISGAASGPTVPGPYPVGFKLIAATDPSRSYPAAGGVGMGERPVRVYVWYPAKAAGKNPLTVGDFVRWAAADFGPSARTNSPAEPAPVLPVPLKEGLDAAALQAVLARPLNTYRDLPSSEGTFPLVILGQGLYYESPLSHIYLCEYLAGRGYIVATCPLVGTQYRLVNLSAEDLESQVRDMEFVLAAARAALPGKTGPLGVIGYDLGGMSGLLLTMRHPEIAAFLSMDSGIVTPHFSGLPGSHPSYREESFTVPWMHMTQARFVEMERSEKPSAWLPGRKKFGDTWIVGVPMENHGGFTSYAAFGIRKGIRGYWDGFGEDALSVHDGICRLAGDFLDATLGRKPAALSFWTAPGDSSGRKGFVVEHRKGAVPPESSRSLLRRIMNSGLASVRPDIDRLRKADPERDIVNESELNWLSYHFLYWWGREKEALDTFRLNADLHPKSADAWAGLGEAHMVTGRKDEAIAAFRRALEIKPDLPGVKEALERLLKK